jgi:hypothetical protein
MATDYRSALIDQLDPEEQAKKSILPPTNTGISGGLNGLETKTGDTMPNIVEDLPSPPLVDAPSGPSPAPKTDYGKAFGTYDQGKWSDPNSKSAKYITARSIDYNAMRQIPDEAGRKAFLAKEVERIKPQLEAAGWKVGGVQGDKMMIGGGPDNFAMNPVDIVGDIEGAATPAWQPPDEGGGSAGGFVSPLGGDPNAGIQQALGQYGNQSDLLQRLIASLQQGSA